MKCRTLALMAVTVFLLHYTPSSGKGVAIAAPQTSEVALQAPKWILSKPTAVYGELIVTQWFPVPNAASYRIYINGEPVGMTDASTYSLKVPQNRGEVRIQVSALSRTGEEGPLSSVEVISLEGISAPTNVKVNPNCEKGTIDIQWNPPEGAVLFQIYRSPEKKGPYELLETIARSNTYTDSSALPGNDYWYTVSAQDMSMKESVKSLEVSGFLDFPTVSPNWVEGYPKLLSPDTIVLKWEPVPGAMGYRAFCNTEPTSLYSVRKALSEKTEATTCQFHVGIPYEDYQIASQISAVYRAGEGPSSGSRLPVYRRLPLNIAVDFEKGMVDLSWDNPEGGGHYFEVYRRGKNKSFNDARELVYKWEQIASSLTDSAFSDGAPNVGEEHYYRVFASDASGMVSHVSPVQSAVRYHALPPQELSVQAHYEEEAVDIRWSLMPGATAYIPFRSESPNGHLKPMRYQSTMKKGYYRDTRVARGSVYWYAVKAIYGEGVAESPFSQRVKVSLADEPFRIPPLNPTMGLPPVDPIRPKGMFLRGRLAPIAVVYDLTWTGPAEISVVFSVDGGKTFPFIPEPGSLTGDVGKGVLPGVDRRITWDWRNQMEMLPPQEKLRSRIFMINVDGPKEP